MITWPAFADEHGDVTLLADPAAVRRRIEAIDVEAGEYVCWDATGRRLDAVVTDGVVVLHPAAEPVARPPELIRVLVGHLLAVPGAVPPELVPGETAAAYLARCVRAAQDAERRFPRRGWWRRTPAPPAPMPTGAPEEQPEWWGEAGFVTRDRIDGVVARALAGLPQGAVEVVHEEHTVELRPRAAGALGVRLDHGTTGLDVFLHDALPAIEITAPVNANYGPPDRPWAEDLADVLAAAAAGHVEISSNADGRAVSVDVLGTRLGAQLGVRPGRVRRRAAPWT